MFHTHSLLCPSEDVPPVSTTLPIWLTSRACWAPDEAARLVVMHRNDNGMQLVVTTYELRAKKSRDGVDILGKDPVLDRTRGSACHHHCIQCFKRRFLMFPLGYFFFPLCEYSNPTNVSLFVILRTGWVSEHLLHIRPSEIQTLATFHPISPLLTCFPASVHPYLSFHDWVKGSVLSTECTQR